MKSSIKFKLENKLMKLFIFIGFHFWNIYLLVILYLLFMALHFYHYFYHYYIYYLLECLLNVLWKSFLLQYHNYLIITRYNYLFFLLQIRHRFEFTLIFISKTLSTITTFKWNILIKLWWLHFYPISCNDQVF